MLGRVADRGVVPLMAAKATSRTEGRPRPLGSPDGTAQVQTQSWKPLHRHLVRVNDAAHRSRQTRFTALFHHVDVAALERALRRLRRRAAPGVDGMTVAEYEGDLENNLQALHARLQANRYRPLPVRRTYIPKADGRQRPLGIPALEDKIVQGAVAEVLNAIYEADFLDCSHGFRPARSPHGALRTVHAAIMSERVNWVVDADIRDFFGQVDHLWMERMVAHRIADPRILRLIRLWLRAGVMEDGVYTDTERGTPQGSGISPLLANIYLHYVLDVWVRQWLRRTARGSVRQVRFADDYLLLFEHQADARQMLDDLPTRLAKFGLSLHEGKTRLVEFGRFAVSNRERRGEKRPETFDFLGFTHYCGLTRKGRFMVQRKTQRSRMIRKLKELRLEMKKRQHAPLAEQSRWLASVLRGHYAYFGITGNSAGITKFHLAVVRWWRWVLRRRGQRPKLPWERFNAVLARFPLPPPRLVHNWRY
jgi:RNA-directed DNA polymerase